MEKFRPYNIFDMKLHLPGEYYLPPANYFVIFWWHKLPIGHVWLQEQDLPADNHAWLTVIWNSIRETVAHYNRLHQALTAGELAGLEQQSFLINAPIFDRLLSHPSLNFRNKNTLSVIICTHNRPAAIATCLQSFAASADKDFELVVVDNASDTDETERVVAQYPRVRYIREPRKGLDIARNTGARHASHGLVAYTDDDVIIHPDWITSIKASFTDPLTMAVTGQVFPAALETKAHYVFERYWGFNRGYKPTTFDHRYFLDHANYGAPAWEIGAGANMAFRREVFDLVGWFDERLDVGASGCSGDSEFWYRILAEGWNCVYQPHVYVHHRHRDTLAGLRQQLFAYMRGNVSSLLVQYEKYRHYGNIRRIKRALPKYYWQKICRHLRYPKDPSSMFVFTEIHGCVAGWRFYKNHARSQPYKDIPIPKSCLLEPARVRGDVLVSIIIPCYNQGHFLTDALASVAAQTYQYYEIIVVDDGSTDETAACCRRHPQVRYVYVHRVGVSAARNIGVAHANGDFLVFLDADDVLYPNALELHLYYMRYAHQAVFVAGSYDKIDTQGNFLEELPPLSGHAATYTALLRGNGIGIQSNCFYRRELFFTFHYDPQRYACEDYALNLSITRHLQGFTYPEKIVGYRLHSSNISYLTDRVLAEVQAVLADQRSFLQTYEEASALAEGLKNWEDYYTLNQT